jgi:hypothetical protein
MEVEVYTSREQQLDLKLDQKGVIDTFKKQKSGRNQRCWKLDEVYLNDTSLRFTIAPLGEQ